MSTQHTPGPWRIGGKQNNGAIVIRGPEPTSEVCIVLQNDRRYFAETTAHIIAAAPDMYEALKKLLADAEHVRDVALREVGIGMVNELALESARAALAKAEGKS